MPKITVAKVITDACGERKLRESAEWLNENLPQHFRRSHMSVKNWQDGAYKPDDVFINALVEFYPQDDPRYKLGAELMTLIEVEKGLVES